MHCSKVLWCSCQEDTYGFTICVCIYMSLTEGRVIVAGFTLSDTSGSRREEKERKAYFVSFVSHANLMCDYDDDDDGNLPKNSFSKRLSLVSPLYSVRHVLTGF